jgi:hypothetical protein
MYQNAKQEVLWAQVEGRLLAMLEGVEPLTLDYLNDATLAWVEREYHRTRHDELACTPLERWLAGPDVGRECADAHTLRQAFQTQTTRVQRRSDLTCSVHGVRFEVPARYRHLERLSLRYARWDLSCVFLIDPHTEQRAATLYPLDKLRNAERGRRALAPSDDSAPTQAPNLPTAAEAAPLLKQLMADYAATGLPPAYLPFDCEDSDR